MLIKMICFGELLLTILLMSAMSVCFSVPGEAAPAFARQLGVKCQTCHFPNPPRLNNVGLVFRRMGFRLPDSDENGNLIFKTPDLPSAVAFGSIIADVELEVDKNAPSETESRTSLRLGEIALFSAHALPDNLSYWLLFIPHNDEGEAELELGEMQYNTGKPTDTIHLRAGKFLMLWWQKVNDEAITLSAPLVMDEAFPTASVLSRDWVLQPRKAARNSDIHTIDSWKVNFQAPFFRLRFSMA